MKGPKASDNLFRYIDKNEAILYVYICGEESAVKMSRNRVKR